MTFDDVRPILSGLVGGAAAVGLAAYFSGRMPKSFRGKSIERLLEENRFPIKVANTLGLIGILGALAMYQLLDYAHNDWRPLALGFGFAFSAPLVWLPLSAVIASRNPGEALVAYSHSQKTPVQILLPLLALGIPLLVLAIWGFLK